MWLLWLTNRWRGVGAVVVTLLAIIAVALIALSRSDTGISLLGDASAARPIASDSPSVVLPRSGSPLISVLDTPLPPSDGVQTVAAAQASWSAAEIAQHQEMVLAAI